MASDLEKLQLRTPEGQREVQKQSPRETPGSPTPPLCLQRWLPGLQAKAEVAGTILSPQERMRLG